MRKPKLVPKYATEADLCAEFIAAVRRDGEWECYPETGGWDILLSRLSDGFQIGIEAKLRLNALVISQALEDSHWSVASPGPDCRAVLVPETEVNFQKICAYIGLTVLTMRGYGFRESQMLPSPPLPSDSAYGLEHWFEWAPAKRAPLPEYVPDSRAGSSAPIQLTTWKIGAIKLAIILEERPLTREDFRIIGIDHRRWIDGRWLQSSPDGLIAASGLPDFRAQHPVNYEQIKADAEKWKPKLLALPAAQRAARRTGKRL